jgi:hypothetical protein
MPMLGTHNAHKKLLFCATLENFSLFKLINKQWKITVSNCSRILGLDIKSQHHGQKWANHPYVKPI